MSSAQNPPGGGDQDRGPALIAIYWTECILAMMMIALRFYTRKMMEVLGADDWMMLASLLLFVGGTCFVTYLATIGGFRHLFYLSPPEQSRAAFYNWINIQWTVLGFGTGKASCALLLLRLIGPNVFWRRLLLYFIVVSVLIVNALIPVFTFAQCSPAKALWTPGIHATCWNSSIQINFGYFQSAYNVFVDVVLALTPISILYKLNLPLRKKLTIGVLVSLCFLASIFGGVKIVALKGIGNKADISWGMYSIDAWGCSEAFVIIVFGSLPALKPLYERLQKRKRAAVDHRNNEDIILTPSDAETLTYPTKFSSASMSTERTAPVIGNDPCDSIRGLHSASRTKE